MFEHPRWRSTCIPREVPGAGGEQVEKLAVFEHPGGFWKLAWNLVGTCLAASTEDGQVQLYSPNMLQEWRLQGSLVGSLDAPDVEAPA